MKTYFYLIILLGTSWCPKALYSQISRISGLEHRPLHKGTNDSLHSRSYDLNFKNLRFKPLYTSKMPILKAVGNSKILIAKLDSVYPYEYKMPIKKMEVAD